MCLNVCMYVCMYVFLPRNVLINVFKGSSACMYVCMYVCTVNREIFVIRNFRWKNFRVEKFS